MELVDILTYNKEKPVQKIEYFKGKAINFVREPNIGLKFLYTCNGGLIYKTPVVVKINKGNNYLILETDSNESYVFVMEDEDAENTEY